MRAGLLPQCGGGPLIAGNRENSCPQAIVDAAQRAADRQPLQQRNGIEPFFSHHHSDEIVTHRPQAESKVQRQCSRS